MQDIILIGLGTMGSSVLTEFGNLLKDRLRLIGRDAEKNFQFHFVHFPLDSPFNYASCSAVILEAVKDSYSRKFNKDFIYMVAGHLGEPATAEQVIDFGYMFELLQINGLLRKKEAVCYLTFSDLLGYTSGSALKQENIRGIYRYFTQLAEYSRQRRYIPPYKNQDGISFGEINTPGPYDRNYIFVTPGEETHINTVTVNVFAEKIFYEIYCFNQVFTEAGKQVHGLRQDVKSENCFSTFSFVQVPRLEELQKYYLNYCFQMQMLDINLLTDVKNINIDYYKKEFLKAIEFTDPDSCFPHERMVNLFVKKYIKHFSHILSPYICDVDFTHYGAECDKRINQVMDSIEPHFNAFLESEMLSLANNIKHLATDLFRVSPLLGHFSLYREFFLAMAQYISSWSNSLEKRLAEIDTFDIKTHFDNAQLRVNALNKQKILDFVLFKPIKQEKIRRIIQALPFDSWIRRKIEKRLLRLLLDYFLNPEKNQNHPRRVVHLYLERIDAFLVEVNSHYAVIGKKKNYIMNLLSFYYVVSYEKPEKFRALLDKMEERSFGLHNKTRLLDYARSFFASWLKEQTDIYDIFYAAGKYLEALEEFARTKGRHLFEIERDVDHEESFAREMEQEVEARLENLTAKSFNTVSHNYLKHLSMILSPAVEQKDPLSLRIENIAGRENVTFKETEGEFTLGSLIFIREYLYMPLRDLVKFDMFKKYAQAEQDAPVRNAGTETPEAKQDADAPLSREDELLAKYTRSIIKEYFPASLKKILYKQIFNTDKELLSDDDINRLSRSAELTAVLNILGDSDLKNVAREYNAVVSTDREKMIKMIERNIRLDMKKR